VIGASSAANGASALKGSARIVVRRFGESIIPPYGPSRRMVAMRASNRSGVSTKCLGVRMLATLARRRIALVHARSRRKPPEGPRI